jgi:hypothetical protein
MPARPVLEVALLASVAALIAALFSGLPLAAAVIALILIGVAGLWVLAYHPMLVFVLMAFFLGAAPGLQVPVLNISIAFVLCAAMWGAVAVMPDADFTLRWPSGLTALVIVASFFSFIGNGVSGASVGDFVRWSITAAAVYPLSALPAKRLATVGRSFVWGCAAAAAFGIALVLGDRDGSLLNHLTILGYSSSGNNVRYASATGGFIPRLTSTYVDPNLGGLILTIGLILTLALLAGRRRFLIGGLLLVAIVLTLSRADAGTVAVAGVVLVLFGGFSGATRGKMFALGMVSGAGLLAVPAVRDRIGDSFSSQDQGSSQRLAALREFPGVMHTHWLLGRGFGLPELNNANVAAVSNYVANAPLLVVYRNGLVIGILYSALLLTAAVASWRLLRGPVFERAAIGAGFLGLLLVALQLDFPVITLSPAILSFAMLLAFVGRPPIEVPEPEPEPDVETATADADSEAVHV